MKKTIIGVVLVVLFVLLLIHKRELLETSEIPREPDSSTGLVELMVDGQTRSAFVYVPDTYSNVSAHSALFLLHGGGGSYEKTYEKVGETLEEIANKYQMLVVVPDAGGRYWNDGRPEVDDGIDDIAFLRSLKELAVGSYEVDAERVFIAGVSNGGLLTQRVACTEPTLFAGYAPIVANMVVEMEAQCQGQLQKPMIFAHGTEDTFMPYKGGEIKHSEALGQGAGGHVLSAQATVDLWADRLGCEAVQVSEYDNDPEDGTSVQHIVYEDCAPGAALEQYQVHGGGHTWFGVPQSVLGDRLVGIPGVEYNAVEGLAAFFRAHGL